jgi:uncharacterized NAD(P)/FAD-binding protein YdhS
MQRNLLSICVIGGAFTGAAGAIACLKRIEQPFSLTIVEPSRALGRGVAYGGQHPLHLLSETNGVADATVGARAKR